MEKRIINNDDIFDNLITIRQDKNAINNESTLFLRIKSTFDKSIFLQLAESVNWKRFSDFPLPNEASLLYDVKEELNVKKDAVGCIVDLFNDIVQEVEDERNKGLFLQIMHFLQQKMLPARNDLKWNNNYKDIKSNFIEKFKEFGSKIKDVIRTYKSNNQKIHDIMKDISETSLIVFDAKRKVDSEKFRSMQIEKWDTIKKIFSEKRQMIKELILNNLEVLKTVSDA
jgi:hypothetical protein